jgi:hypothetical protein
MKTSTCKIKNTLQICIRLNIIEKHFSEFWNIILETVQQKRKKKNELNLNEVWNDFNWFHMVVIINSKG